MTSGGKHITMIIFVTMAAARPFTNSLCPYERHAGLMGPVRCLGSLQCSMVKTQPHLELS